MCIPKTVRISWVIKRRGVISKLVTFTDTVTVYNFKFFRIQQDEIIANTYFLASFYCSEWNYEDIRTI